MQPCLTQNQWKQLKVCPSGCPSVPYIDKPSVFAHLQSKLLSFFTHPPTITGQLCGGRTDQNLYETLDFSWIMANVSSRRSGGSCSWRGNKAGYCLLLLLACLLACLLVQLCRKVQALLQQHTIGKGRTKSCCAASHFLCRSSSTEQRCTNSTQVPSRPFCRISQPKLHTPDESPRDFSDFLEKARRKDFAVVSKRSRKNDKIPPLVAESPW